MIGFNPKSWTVAGKRYLCIFVTSLRFPNSTMILAGKWAQVWAFKRRCPRLLIPGYPDVDNWGHLLNVENSGHRVSVADELDGPSLAYNYKQSSSLSSSLHSQVGLPGGATNPWKCTQRGRQMKSLPSNQGVSVVVFACAKQLFASHWHQSLDDQYSSTTLFPICHSGCLLRDGVIAWFFDTKKYVLLALGCFHLTFGVWHMSLLFFGWSRRCYIALVLPIGTDN